MLCRLGAMIHSTHLTWSELYSVQPKEHHVHMCLSVLVLGVLLFAQ